MQAKHDTPDAATEAKLLEAAGQVFCEVGFQAATVRKICSRAGANVAAVNYHFGDKLGLYLAVVRHSMGAVEHRAIRAALAKPGPPEERLRSFLRQMFRMVHSADRPGWYFKIMAHELAQPSPALARVVDEIIRPNYQKFAEVIGEIIGCAPGDDVTRMCLHSVMAQVMHYAHGRAVIRRLWPSLQMTPERVDQIADHIASFSLAGFAAVAGARRASAVVKRKAVR